MCTKYRGKLLRLFFGGKLHKHTHTKKGNVNSVKSYRSVMVFSSRRDVHYTVMPL